MAAPTFPAAADLVEGTGTRSFAAVTTLANDWLVVEIIVELGVSGVPAMSPLTWTQQNDRDDGSGRTEIFQFTTQDTVGGSRTVQIVPNTTANYRARLTVVRGSTGPGTGKGTAAVQTVSVARQGANSAMFMTVGDWSAGAVGSPVWTPGGATVASQQGSAGTYILGRWDDSGTAGTASHGISSPSYATPSIAVLEMLGTAGGTVSGSAALAAAGTLTATAAVLTPGSASLTAAGSVTAAGVVIILGTAALAGAGTLSASTGGSTSGTASLAGTGTLTAAAVLGRAGTASLTGAGTLSATAVVRITGAAALVGAGSLSATGAARVFGTAALTAAGSLTATATAGSATVTRPNTGTTARPSTGTTSRPGSGTTARASSGTTARP